jgi:orotidine-5'-phosphate decarboxylase
MNPADRLIVALDLPVDDSFDLVGKLRLHVSMIKLGIGTFLHPRGWILADRISREGICLMLDLKLYDTRDTVRRTMECVAKLGASMVTVHADCAEHATGFGPKVLAVRALTDGTGRWRLPEAAMVDGIVCPVSHARALRAHTDKLLVCPGIRPVGIYAHNHKTPATPYGAIKAGADYIVVGRPIYAAHDPVAAVRAITREMAE